MLKKMSESLRKTIQFYFSIVTALIVILAAVVGVWQFVGSTSKVSASESSDTLREVIELKLDRIQEDTTHIRGKLKEVDNDVQELKRWRVVFDERWKIVEKKL